MQPTCCPLGAAASHGRKGWEPIAKWLDYSREAWAISHEAIKLKSARERPRFRSSRLFDRMTEWLELAAVPIAAYPDLYTGKSWPCGLSTTFAISGVFQIVALQLLCVVAGGRKLAQCTHCGIPFVITGNRRVSDVSAERASRRKFPFDTPSVTIVLVYLSDPSEGIE